MKLVRIAVAALAVVCGTTLAESAPTGAQLCLAAKEKALAKYESCVWKAQSKAAKGGTSADLAACQTKFDEAWASADTKFGADCPDATAETIRTMFSEYMDSVLAQIEPEPGACNVHAQDCPDGMACYPGGSDDTACFPPGTTPEGGSCTQPNDCMEGFVCVNDGSGSRCREICQPSDPQCETPDRTCVSIVGFTDTGVCL